MRQYYTYIVSSPRNNVLYIGMTNDLERRILEHRIRKGSKFASKYNCHKLLWYETFPTALEAIQMEKRLKRWKREWKENLIRSVNAEFRDLAGDWDCL